ncbi:ParB/RepB/Spo0J family partition protein [Lactococcus termiticola]|uniref:Chromosome partitioning protein ParB n=1 Tax=Lactococcus termiticola TaxID=2169526 RepID=A0A2R5HHR8_9LACT|nr:ParB/RepB/Spo0J family partition protein [Lactococcus termiticola]GBG96905.1 chromosome partitioning protein ParB [Lactococcus termiticola]
MTEAIEYIPLKSIVKNPYQPRTHFDEEALEELADSIKENGVLQPIILRESKVIGYELLAGERRFQASKKAGLTEIPAIVRDYDDEEMMRLAILENLQRENLDPIEEARSLQALKDKLVLSPEDISKQLGKSRSYVSNSLRLLKLPESILTKIETGELSAGHGRTLLAVKQADKQEALALRTIKEKLSVRQLESLIYPPKKSPKAKAINHAEALEEELKQIIGNQVKIKANKKNQGQISISFDDLEQLDLIVERLKRN